MFSSEADVDEAHAIIAQTFSTGTTKPLAWRRWQLKQVWWMLTDYEPQILAALHADLHKPAWESHITDILALKQDVLATLSNLQTWTKDTHPGGSLVNHLGRTTIRKEPLGAALIIGTWNFPFLVTLQPMLAAIAAGCTVLLKPSEVAPASQDLMVEMVEKYLDSTAIRIVTGGATEMRHILSRKYGMIFYTGSPSIARVVARASAEHLTPTVLELGGQGPAIVAKDADVDLAAKRIAAAKFLNAGQICLSVNHVFVEPEVKMRLLERLWYWFDRFNDGGEDWEGMCRIVSEKHYDRVVSLLEKTKGKVVYGGKRNRVKRFLEPTVVVDLDVNDPLLSVELFAPILPIVTASIADAIAHINSHPPPLALYPFTSSLAVSRKILDSTVSGGASINDAMIHASLANAPFGGVGESGHGAYHGVYGVNAFSHLRTVVNLPTWMDLLMSGRYPPYDMSRLKRMRKGLGVPDTPSFKRGEGVDDQSEKRFGVRSMLTTLVVLLLGVLSVLFQVQLDGDVGKLRVALEETSRRITSAMVM
ncbi:aldehyde dehydrogenase [Lophium mytilinum]|uniref:Aldehyde dehydrogenase n=1 Tax=Lophium mytilinum TaxID=390894 RepID=A0A6A6REQ3_9PEZI|nr:aldehyde dehydrogenase [Lophium mytilinum]